MHTGLFPEQAAHWRWLRGRTAGRELDVLNLFAYTGGASLALARLGHRVTHVDASRPVVSWARRNAALNDLTAIRWIEEDARAFVRREGRRGRRYGGLLLDPPAFGRGGQGVWRIDTDLDPLLDDALALLEPGAAFVLVNVYGIDDSPGAIAKRVSDRLDAARHPLSRESIDAGTLDLSTPDGRTLPTGVYARVARAGGGLR
jgi:23S rRNA (cytosine1962-C5)-methyltransferase